MIERIQTGIRPETCKRLVDTIPRRLKTCQMGRGGTMNKY